MTRVSYIVPIFNKAPYLPSVLRSIARQTGDFEREIIAIDDGSTDDSAAVLDLMREEIATLRALRLADDGPAVAINRAAAVATGDFFKFVDGDDLLAPNATAILLRVLADSGAVLAYGDCADYDTADLPIDVLPEAIEGPVEIMEDPLPALIRNVFLTMTGTMAPAAAFRAVGGCDERVFVHDTPLFLRLAAIGRFAHVRCDLAWMPRTDPARWSNRALGQVLHDVNAAMGYMIADNPSLPVRLKNRAAQRAASRAWTWARREGGATPLSRHFARNLLCRLPLPCGHATLIARTLSAFRETGAIRVPADATDLPGRGSG